MKNLNIVVLLYWQGVFDNLQPTFNCYRHWLLSGLNTRVRVAETNKYTKIAPDFGSSSRRAKGSILSICDFCHNAEDGPKDKSAEAG